MRQSLSRLFNLLLTMSSYLTFSAFRHVWCSLSLGGQGRWAGGGPGSSDGSSSLSCIRCATCRNMCSRNNKLLLLFFICAIPLPFYIVNIITACFKWKRISRCLLAILATFYLLLIDGSLFLANLRDRTGLILPLIYSFWQRLVSFVML